MAETPDDPVNFEEAIAALRRRVPMTDEQFAALEEAEREYAFTVAGVAELDVVADVYEAIERAVEDGTTFEDFEVDVGGQLSGAWGGEDPARLETVFRNNVQTAYNAGRYESATAPAVADERPYWRYDSIVDADTTEICLACNGVVLPADHPWWRTHYPPCHHRCRAMVTTLTQRQAERDGITDSPPDIRAMTGFGKAPTDGGRDWAPEPDDYPAPLAAELEDKVA